MLLFDTIIMCSDNQFVRKRIYNRLFCFNFNAMLFINVRVGDVSDASFMYLLVNIQQK